MATNARDLFERRVAQWTQSDYLCEADDALPDAQLTWWKLHPFETAVFGIDPALCPRLLEAYRRYVGAVAGLVHDEYHDFHDQERERWERSVARDENSAVFNYKAILGFMNEAAGLPLRQCDAMIQKWQAMELRSAVKSYRDEDDAPTASNADRSSAPSS